MKIRHWVLSILILIVLSYTIIFGISNSQENKDYSDTSVILDDGWTLDFNGVITDNYSFSTVRFPMTNKGDKISLTTAVPKEIPVNPILCFRTVHSDIAVYIDGEEIYTYGQTNYDAGRFVGSGRHYIDLKTDYAGKTMTIVLRVSENKAFSSLQTPYICNSNFIHRDFIKRHQFEILCIMFLVVTGILGMILALFKAGQDQTFKPLWGIAAFSFSIGAWSLCTSDIVGYFTYSIVAKSIIEYVSLYASPFCAIFYFGYDIENEEKRRKIIHRILLYLSGTFLIASCLLHTFNIVRFPDLLIVCHILIVAEVIYLASFNIYDALHGKYVNKPLILGFTCLTFFVCFDLIKFNIGKFSTVTSTDNYTSVIYIGVLCFIISLLYDFLDRTLKSAFKKVELDTFEKMAYTDMLTGIANRRRCDVVFDQIVNNGTPYTVICFDLNDLKQVNDTYGHAEGDEYICSFARILEASFNNNDVKIVAGDVIISRAGGDEFLVVLYGKVLNFDYVEHIIDTMNDRIHDFNLSHANWTMSTAYGIAISTEENAADPKQVVKIADDRMYAKKREMK